MTCFLYSFLGVVLGFLAVILLCTLWFIARQRGWLDVHKNLHAWWLDWREGIR